MTSIFAEATRKAASARFKQPQLDAEGQEIEVGELITCHVTLRVGVFPFHSPFPPSPSLSSSCCLLLQVDIREDEEQSVKLRESIDLLLAAGYFRARIKGLSPFDKIVGGMTWCIQASNFDVDVDLLFQENSTIGQKM